MAILARPERTDIHETVAAPSADRAPRLHRGGQRGTMVAALALTALVVAAAARPAQPLTEIGALAPDALARLTRPASYVALAPLCDLYDALSLLTIRQHLAVLAWLAMAFVIARGLAARRRGGTGAWREARAALVVACGICAFYLAGALITRPMAALALADRDLLTVDVHSHTSASHDGRWDFDAERNRAWHRAAGFDAAYITDHREYAGAEAAARGNPARAGLGTVLLPGVETRVGPEHVNVLGVRAADSIDANGWLDVRRLRRAHASTDADRPIILLTAPAARIDRMLAYIPIDAIEVVDGAPRGLSFTRVHGAEIRSAAERRGASVVAGSDLHGWGRTAAAWTVVRLPGWRAMTPERLDVALRTALRDPAAVSVVARTAPPPPFTLAAWLTAPAAIAWHLFASMTGAERVSWLAWTWAVWALALVGARRRRSLGREESAAWQSAA